MSSITDVASALHHVLDAPPLDPAVRDDRLQDIYREVLRRSRAMADGNFRAIHASDLGQLFRLYDERMFAGHLGPLVDRRLLSFRLSKRMTRCGGTTTERTTIFPDGRVRIHYEIAVAANLLLQTFREGDRPVRVGGRPCRDRLEALQRIFEHELIHLSEMLVWRNSSCRGARFQQLARRLFGHTEHAHELITPRERALADHGLRPGDRVQFVFEGRSLQGIINRITRRATVLVEDSHGLRYNDGRRYRKFYVPLVMLQRNS